MEVIAEPEEPLGQTLTDIAPWETPNRKATDGQWATCHIRDRWVVGLGVWESRRLLRSTSGPSMTSRIGAAGSSKWGAGPTGGGASWRPRI